MHADGGADDADAVIWPDSVRVVNRMDALTDHGGYFTSDTYDSNGNTTASGADSYTYDFENHLLTQTGSTAVTLCTTATGIESPKRQRCDHEVPGR